MAFVKKQFGVPRDTTMGGLPFASWSYWSSADALATIVASAYFDDLADQLHKDDVIWVAGSDDAQFVKVTSANGVTPVTVSQVTGAAPALSLAEGSIYVGNAASEAAAVDFKTSGQIGIGDGITFSSVAVSQDASIDATGAVTVISAQGSFQTGVTGTGTVINSGITTSSGAGAVGITGRIHEISATGVGDALTLADGAPGQALTILYVAQAGGTDTAIVTPTTLAGGTTITFNNLGDSADLTFSATGGWYMHGGTATIA